MFAVLQVSKKELLAVQTSKVTLNRLLARVRRLTEVCILVSTPHDTTAPFPSVDLLMLFMNVQGRFVDSNAHDAMQLKMQSVLGHNRILHYNAHSCAKQVGIFKEFFEPRLQKR